jgi:hypothetical protein
VSASGNAEASVVQWTADLEKLVGEAAEVLELDGLEVAGVARGRLDLDRAATSGTAHARLSASLSDFVLARPGRPAWRDAELAIEAEGAGTLSEHALLVDRGRAVVSAADDVLEVTLTGGALVNLAPLLGGPLRREVGIVIDVGLITRARVDVSVGAQALVDLSAEELVDRLAGGFADSIPLQLFVPRMAQGCSTAARAEPAGPAQRGQRRPAEQPRPAGRSAGSGGWRLAARRCAAAAARRRTAARSPAPAAARSPAADRRRA